MYASWPFLEDQRFLIAGKKKRRGRGICGRMKRSRGSCTWHERDRVWGFVSSLNSQFGGQADFAFKAEDREDPSLLIVFHMEKLRFRDSRGSLDSSSSYRKKSLLPGSILPTS